jgi:hypothetical protein
MQHIIDKVMSEKYLPLRDREAGGFHLGIN